MAAAVDELRARRDSDLAFSVALLADRGWTPRADPAETAAVLGYLVAPESYLHLVEQAGWSLDRYREWLLATVRSLFTQP